ncbi:MAG: hypothetical protein K0S55_1373, partial [Clostridia bacterium]|nr:hypothetical protein [Clostridia bacterium]
MNILHDLILTLKSFIHTMLSKKPEDIKKSKKNKLIVVYSIASLLFIVLLIMNILGVFLPDDYKKIRLGEKLLSTEQFLKAEQAFSEAAELNERQKDASNNGLIRTYDAWIISLLNQKTYNDEILSLFEKLINKNPENSINYLRQANVLAELKRYSDAEASCKKALELDKKSEAAYDLYAQLRIFDNDPSEAVSILKKGIEITGSSSLLSFHDRLIPKAPKFSMVGGSYDYYITLEINSENEECMILYTLDGSDPNPQNSELSAMQTS